MRRRSLLALLVSVALAGTAASAAAAYPERQVTIVVAAAPGGGADNTARQVLDKLNKVWGRDLAKIEYKPGGGGSVGIQEVVDAPADGYTLLLGTSAVATLQASKKNLPFDSPNDLSGISSLIVSPYVLVVGKDSDIDSVETLIKKAKSQPNGLAYGSPGVGSPTHLTTAQFGIVTEAPLTHVPYQGVGKYMADLIAGRLDFAIANLEAVRSHVASGNVKPLAITGDERIKLLAETPTLSELGIAGFPNSGIGYAVLAPKETPRDVIALLNAQLREGFDTDEVRSELDARGSLLVLNTPEEYDAALVTEIAKWQSLLKAVGINN